MQLTAPWQFWIDVGGTFTDCVGVAPDGSIHTHKLLSTASYRGVVGAGSTRDTIVDEVRSGDPSRFYRGFRLRLPGPDRAGGVAVESVVTDFDCDGGRFRLEEPLSINPQAGMAYELAADADSPVVGIHRLLGLPLDLKAGPIRLRLGTTRGTNALLERNGAATVFITTAGFGDLLEIGDQSRPRLFDLNIRKPRPLPKRIVEIDERIEARGEVIEPLNETSVRPLLAAALDTGCVSAAICLLNSHRNAAHEIAIERLAREAGFSHVSRSTALNPVQGFLARSESTVINAYLAPMVRDYFDRIRQRLPEATLDVMTSAGTLVGADSLEPIDAILSGPAGGVVACADVARRCGIPRVIGFDMGGTSTDVCRWDGALERRFEMGISDRETGGTMRIRAPMLSIETVAAGGGSICAFDGIKPVVGPRSCGADPGPACYGRGGPLAVTDANALLGRVVDDNFPFALDREAAGIRLRALRDEIQAHSNLVYEPHELALGLIRIANAHMTSAIRRISTQRGYDPRDHALVVFGGAGGQHACAVARELGITSIIVPRHVGLLSAVGIGAAEHSRFAVRDVHQGLSDETFGSLLPWYEAEARDLAEALIAGGSASAAIRPPVRSLDLRYRGQEAALTIDEPDDSDWRGTFEREHQRLFGFGFPDRDVEVCVARLRVTAESFSPMPAAPRPARSVEPRATCRVFLDNRWEVVSVLNRDAFESDESLAGPAMIIEPTSTLLLERGWRAASNAAGDLILSADDATASKTERHAIKSSAGDEIDPVTLEVYSSTFENIAEQMGSALQRTAISTNVKERLDFSCAVFDAEGGLVSHAPHIPVHLGAMETCVRRLIHDLAADGEQFHPGDIYVTNDPFRGGSHLPDVTVITPVFDAGGQRLLHFTASRAHHAEIGGIAPGSMPSASRTLADEGVLIRRLRLHPRAADELESARDHARERGDVGDSDWITIPLRRAFSSGPHPSRNVDENIADIQAQIAANHVGAARLIALIAAHGADGVARYIAALQAAAESRTRSLLARLPRGSHAFGDQMDDGTAIRVRVDLSGDSAVIDFAGTSPVHPGNLNATDAIVASAVLYCFRCLIGEDVPLNSGIMRPLTVRLPDCFLNPMSAANSARPPAVAGGNVETSQRIVDVLFGALGCVAAGQGTMNNLSFGNGTISYYETIGGGAGAGDGFAGASGVHVHMTNTRITDAEVLEHRYPVRLRQFSLRPGSGGHGRHRGGDGLVREIEFLAPLHVSLLTQRRAHAPFGLCGGGPGATGRNTLIRANGNAEALGSIAALSVEPGDHIRIETPGGGGYGA